MTGARSLASMISNNASARNPKVAYTFCRKVRKASWLQSLHTVRYLFSFPLLLLSTMRGIMMPGGGLTRYPYRLASRKKTICSTSASLSIVPRPYACGVSCLERKPILIARRSQKTIRTPEERKYNQMTSHASAKGVRLISRTSGR